MTAGGEGRDEARDEVRRAVRDEVPGAQPGVVDPRLIDALLAVAMALAIAVVIAADFDGPGESGPVSYVFALGFGALVLIRRRWPRTLLVLTVLGIFVYYALGLPVIGMALPAVAALYSAAELGRTAWAAGAGAVLVGVAAYFRVDEGQPLAYLYGYEILTNVALVAAAIALGVAVRLTREARAQSERVRALTAAEQAQAADRRLEAERVRIARDLHDVLGHHLSVVALHANVAGEAVGADDAAARAALGQVGDATSAALRELRTTVKVLRGPLPDGAPRGATSLAGLDALVRPARATGLDVVLDVDVPRGALDGAIDAAAFRIVQESLTNVLRHAGARRATVAAHVADGRLRLRVVDDGAGSGVPDSGRRGQGIAGMVERAALLGGRLAAHDAPGGGFAVEADLPARLDA
ncbi:sensor histidine kinase [Cellulosimicrobium marinum]|uniref:sensor histidine kinase n=1 Tax=Cellulosimicrobium marinum TaxID=1638992 RepID=UPI001E536C8C|nr:sensor histidine kinase [Cellulosimicrobium marinum]MCB7135372.1 sensor histidine kinase [Cellulosimicrobium marinum]